MKLPWTFTRPGSGWVMGPQGIYVERGVDEPRYQWTPDGRSEGLLIERQATNIWQYPEGSHDLTNRSVRGATTANFVSSPNELGIPYTQFREVDGVEGVWGLWQVFGQGVGQLVTHVSIFRLVGRRFVHLGVVEPTANQFRMIYDTEQKEFVAVGASGYFRSQQVIPLSGNWFISYVTAEYSTASGGHGRFCVIPMSGTTPSSREYIGDSDKGVDVAYAGVMLGEYRGSPIIASGSSVTRPADTLYADMSLVEGFDPTKGTIVFEWTELQSVGYPISLSSSLPWTSSANAIVVNRPAGSPKALRVLSRVNSANSNSSTTLAHGLELEVGSKYRMAIRYSNGETAFSVSGIPVISNALPGGVHEGLRYLRVGQDAHALYRQVRYIPHAVSDAELQQLSSLT